MKFNGDMGDYPAWKQSRAMDRELKDGLLELRLQKISELRALRDEYETKRRALADALAEVHKRLGEMKR